MLTVCWVSKSGERCGETAPRQQVLECLLVHQLMLAYNDNCCLASLWSLCARRDTFPGHERPMNSGRAIRLEMGVDLKRHNLWHRSMLESS